MSIDRYEPTDLNVETLRINFAPEATNQELMLFGKVCAHLELDPFAGHIYLIGRNQKVYDPKSRQETYRKVHRPQIAVAGRRYIAERTGKLQGIEGPEWCGPRRYDTNGDKLPLIWEELWDEDAKHPPYAARCFVYRDGWKVPANGTAKFEEFAVWEGPANNRHLGVFWERAPSHMLGKVAEALALRRAFPEVHAAVAFVEGPGEPDDNTVLAEAGEPPQPALEEPQPPEPPPPAPESPRRQPRRNEEPPPWEGRPEWQ